MNQQPACQPDKGWNFKDSAEKEAFLKPLCQQVEKLFDLSARRLYRYFADCDDPCFVENRRLGRYYRGFHVQYSRQNVRELPLYLADCFYYPEYQLEKMNLNCPIEDLVAFDDLIYVRHSTCSDSTGCVITYAHELQHVVQYARFPKLMRLNSVFCENLASWDPTAMDIDIPAERDANATSKRAAGIICGMSKVSEFAHKEIKSMEWAYKTGQADAREKKVKWEFFRDISSCDLKLETLSLGQKYKKQLADLGIDIDQPGLLDD